MQRNLRFILKNYYQIQDIDIRNAFVLFLIDFEMNSN